VARQTGIAHYPREGQPPFAQYLGKVIGFEHPQNIPRKLQSQLRFLNRGSLLGLGAAHEAMTHCGMDVSAVPPQRRALYIASGDLTRVGYDFLYPATKDATDGLWQRIDFKRLNDSTLSKVNPFFLLESISNNLFSFLSAFLGFMGSNTSLAAQSPCGAQALELACRSIQQNRADIAIVVGCGNWITDVPLHEMDGLGLLSKCKQGIHSYRPFDGKRDGFIPGEGGAAIFLEEAGAAEARGAPAWAAIRGFGNCFQGAAGGGFPVPAEVSPCSVQMALTEARCVPGDLAFICPHGSGTQKGDRSELRSIAEVLGEAKKTVPLCGLKPYTGHLGAASDVAEIILATKAVAHKLVPATLNFCKADEEFSDLQISNAHQICSKRHCLSTSYGIIGQTSSVAIEVL
jgi:3-oxoacyl-[acyl-carrier-protein] synthase II